MQAQEMRRQQAETGAADGHRVLLCRVGIEDLSCSAERAIASTKNIEAVGFHYMQFACRSTQRAFVFAR